jgi:hypothetical protein
MLPLVEIRTGLRAIVNDHIGVRPREAIVEVARMLGFQRTGPELQRVIEGELRALLDARTLERRNGERLYPFEAGEAQ